MEQFPINNPENNLEKIPSEQEVLEKFAELINSDYETVRRLEDEDGVYLLEVKVETGENEYSEYTYQRKGLHPGSNSDRTAIDVAYYEDDIPVGGNSVMKFEDGQWRKTE